MPLTPLKLRANKLPWWTWILPLPIFFLGTLISLEAKVTAGTALFYFPLPFALTLVYWWGPRVLPAFYLNAVGCAGLWGLERIELWPVYGAPEVIFVFLSWLVYVKILSGKVWLPDTKHLIYFLIGGIVIPLIIYKFILESVFVLAGDAAIENYWNLLITTGFGDFVSAFCVSTPLLHFLTRFMAGKKLLYNEENLEGEPYAIIVRNWQWIELIVVLVMAYCINHFLGFADYWFLNGILSLYVAMRFGFGATVLINSYILIITYVVPAADSNFSASLFLESEMLKTQLGTALLYVFSIMTGRVVSDTRIREAQLNQQNKELNLMNAELDRFVYSVSHDLSAPLKSIQGLVNISRTTENLNEHRQQFNFIETSVRKLESFISEVLDFSVNKRTEVEWERINLAALCHEVYHNLKLTEGFEQIDFKVENLGELMVISDKVRLKIILNNIFSNAIRFRRRDQQSFIRLRTELNDSKLTLLIEDNGEGIKPELQQKIFDMFFRGTDRSQGSGLGLYIAREAAQKIQASIYVESIYGKGSTFRLTLGL